MAFTYQPHFFGRYLIPTPYTQLHSGANLATALKRVFEEFKISEKVSIQFIHSQASLLHLYIW